MNQQQESPLVGDIVVKPEGKGQPQRVEYPCELTLYGRFSSWWETAGYQPDYENIFRGLSGDVGCDPQLDTENAFLWAFHEATSNSEHTRTDISLTLSYRRRALIPLIFWACHTRDLLGDFHLEGIDLHFHEGLETLGDPFEIFRYMEPLPQRPGRDEGEKFQLSVTSECKKYDSNSLHSCLEHYMRRIEDIPSRGFDIQSSTEKSEDLRSHQWDISGDIHTWNYLEIGYVIDTCIHAFPTGHTVKTLRFRVVGR